MKSVLRFGDDRCGLDAVDASVRRRASQLGRCARILPVLSRRRSGSVAVVVCVALGAFLLSSASALASGQRGHVFGFAFGGQGSSAGQFSDPTGVAVSNSTGDVYVADREDNRVEEFETVATAGEPTEEKPIAEFSVPNPKGIAVDNCTNNGVPCTVAEDPSVGDVYVIGATAKVVKTEPSLPDTEVYKFSATGAVLPPHKFTALVEGVAVGTSGELFVYWGPGDAGTVSRLNNAEKNAKPSNTAAPLKETPTSGLGVDSNGDPFIAGIASKEEAGSEALTELVNELEHEKAPVISKLEWGTGKVLVHALDFAPSSGVAVNEFGTEELNDVYVDNLTSVATFGPDEHASSPGEGEGDLLQRFTAPGLKHGAGLAVDPANGAVYVADEANNVVDVFEPEPAGRPTVEALAASDDEGSRILSAEIRPTGSDTHYHFEYGHASCASGCTSTASTDIGGGFGVGEAAAELPAGLEPGTYHYRVVAENGSGEVKSAEQTFEVVAASDGLLDGRGWEMVSPPNKGGAEPETINREGGRIQAAANGDAFTFVADGPMPTNREPEGVRNPELTQIFSTRNREPGHETWESQDLTTPNATGGGTAVGEPPEFEFFSSSLALALVNPFPDETGPFQIPRLAPPLAGETAGEQENTIYLRDNRPLLPEAAEAESYAKAQKNGELMEPQNPGYLPLVTKLNEPGPKYGRELLAEGLRPSAATEDLSHVVFRSEKANSGLYEWTGNEDEQGTLQPVSVLPASEGGALVPTTPPQAGLGGGQGDKDATVDVRHAISSDGSLVVWTLAVGGTHLYLRDTQLKETVQLSAPGEADAVYQTASADGSKIYFTDTQRLTPESGAIEGEPSQPDLYVFEPEVTGGHLSGKLTDLTPPEQGGRAADVLVAQEASNGVLGATEKEETVDAEPLGSYVYFVANGALASGANRGHCGIHAKPRPAGTTCNLYVRHFNSITKEWEPTKLVAALSAEDAPDWGDTETAGNLAFMTSRVSPDGRYVAFMSKRRLTGYDNEDVSGKGRQDEEVFLYDALHENLVCASCNPSGARPTGVFDTRSPSGEGVGLVIDRSGIWSAVTTAGTSLDHWLAGSIPGWTTEDIQRSLYQSRYLSNSGRLFFNSADPLVPIAQPTRTETIEKTPEQVGVENVYEYEPPEIGACHEEAGCVGLVSSGTSEHESAFLDASENGNDVFFLTAAEIAPQDVDSNFDIYDAHVCEVAAPCPAAPKAKPSECEGEACQGTVPPPEPGANASGTSINLGTSNLSGKGGVLPTIETKPGPTTTKPLTRAQKLTKALKSCRTKYKQKSKESKRTACEKQAKKKYGPIKPSATKSSVTGAGR